MQYLKPKYDEIGREREKNILGPNSADTGPWQENSEKNSKKIRKIEKNLYPALFLDKTGWDRPRKGEKNFSPEFSSYLTPERKFRKKISKNIQKNKKLLSSIIFSQNEMRLGEKGRKKF